MKEQIVSFEVAKLAKKLGFNWSCDNYYNEDGILNSYKDTIALDFFKGFARDYHGNKTYRAVDAEILYLLDHDNSDNTEILAPTQSFLQKWFREIHGIHVYAHYIKMRSGKTLYRYYIGEKPSERFKTYEEALEEGLLEALKLI